MQTQLTDGQLLARFLQERDESAFEELVKRHARMVMVACKRVLENTQDAEEAFQKTFLTLIRKAEMRLRAESIGGWLYCVAVGTALNMRRLRLLEARHLIAQEDIERIPQAEESISMAWEAMKGVLDEELIQLADKYRQPLILCYVEGKTPDEAAVELDINHNTFRIRLMRGRELLRKRLVRRGIVASVNLLNAVLLEKTQATEVVSEVLVQSTVKTAMATFSAVTTAGILTGGWKGVLLAMTMKKTALIIGGLVLLGLIGSVAYWSQGKQKSLPPVRELPAIVANKQVEKPSETFTAQTVTTEQINDSAEKITLPESIDDFLKRFAQGLKATGAEKWKIWRQLGIGLTDEEFEAAEGDASHYQWYNQWINRMRAEQYGSQTNIPINVRKNYDDRFLLLGLEPGEAPIFLDLQNAIFSKWVDKDPIAAVEWTARLLSFPQQKDFKGYFFLRIDDLEKLLPDRYYSLTGTPGNFMSALVMRWGINNLSAAKEWAQTQPKGLVREAALCGLALAMSHENPAEAFEIIGKEKLILGNETPLQYPYIRCIFASWILKDRAGAIAYLSGLPTDGDYYEIGMSALGYQMFKEDMPGALRLAETLPDTQKNWFLRDIVKEWVKKDFPSARDYVTHMWENQEGEDNFYMLRAIVNGWFFQKQDPKACAEWAMQLTDKHDPNKKTSNMKELIVSDACTVWAYHTEDPEAVFQWAENLPPDHWRDVAWEAIIEGGINKICNDNEIGSIKEGFALIDESIPEKYRKSARRELIMAWQNDKDAGLVSVAADWIQTLPNDNERDDLLRLLCVRESKASYADRIQWASAIQDENRRVAVSEKVLDKWFHEDPAAAKQWLQSSTLPRAVKDKWLAGK